MEKNEPKWPSEVIINHGDKCQCDYCKRGESWNMALHKCKSVFTEWQSQQPRKLDEEKLAKVAYSGYFGCGKVQDAYWLKDFKSWKKIAKAVNEAYLNGSLFKSNEGK